MSVGNGGRSEYDTVKQEYISSTSVNDKEACLQALSRSKDRELARDFLEFVTSEAVPIQDSHHGANGISTNNYTRDEIWDFTKTEWKRLNDRLGVSKICLDRWMKMGLDHFASNEIERDIAEFFEDKDTRGFDRALVVISDTIKSNASYQARDEGLVLEWLEAHGYL